MLHVLSSYRQRTYYLPVFMRSVRCAPAFQDVTNGLLFLRALTSQAVFMRVTRIDFVTFEKNIICFVRRPVTPKIKECLSSKVTLIAENSLFCYFSSPPFSRGHFTSHARLLFLLPLPAHAYIAFPFPSSLSCRSFSEIRKQKEKM